MYPLLVLCVEIILLFSLRSLDRYKRFAQISATCISILCIVVQSFSLHDLERFSADWITSRYFTSPLRLSLGKFWYWSTYPLSIHLPDQSAVKTVNIKIWTLYSHRGRHSYAYISSFRFYALLQLPPRSFEEQRLYSFECNFVIPIVCVCHSPSVIGFVFSFV